MLPAPLLAMIARLATTVRFLRLRPFDTSTEQGRSDERHRRVALTSIAALISRMIAITTGLITVPLTLHYLGAERYGMWMTMSSLVAMLGFADFGIGNGLMNEISSANGRDDSSAIRGYITSGLLVLSAIALVILLLFAAAYPFLDWYALFNVKSPEARAEAGPALAALVLCFALAIPLNIVLRVQIGLQAGFASNLWQCAGSVLSLMLVVVAIYFQASLIWLVLALAGSPLIINLLNSLIYFGQQEPRFAPRLGSVSSGAVRRIARTGMLFFVLQIVGAMSYTSDNIIIAQILGAKAVADYAVPMRLFSVVSLALSIVVMPLWPAYGEAFARGDRGWIEATLKRSFWISVVFSGGVSLALLAFSKSIIHAWVGAAVVPSLSLLLALGVWQVVQAGGNAASMYFNGAGLIRFQVVVSMIAGVGILTLKIAFVYWMGIPGAVWSTVVGFLIFAAIPQYWRISRELRTVPTS